MRFDQEGDDLIDLYLEVDTSLIGRTFSYWVNVVNKDSELGSSQVMENVYVIENTDPPDNPTGLKIIPINENSLTLMWTDVLRETGYKLYRKDGETGIYRVIRSLDANTVIIDENSLSPYIEYFYKVKAYNEYGESGFSNEVSSKGTSQTIAPSNLQAQALGATTVLLSWTNNSTSTGLVEIQRRITADTVWDTVSIISGAFNEFTDQGLIASTRYTYRVAAYVSSVMSDYSNEAEVVTAEKDAFAPANLHADFDSDIKRVRISWDNNNPTGEISSTFLERRELNTDEYVAIGATDFSNNFYIDSSLTFDKTYQYRARFYTIDEFYTPYSNEDTAYVPILPPTLTITEFEFGKSYFLQWDYEAQNETGFDLQRRSDNGSFESYISFSIDTRAYTDNVPDPTKIYFYRIRAFQGTDSLSFSNTVSTAGGTGNILKPTNLDGTVPDGEEKVILTWLDNSTNELAFEVERKRESTSVWEKLSTLPPDTQTYTDETGIFGGETWQYRVRAINGTDVSDYSNVVTIFIPYI